MNEGMYLRKMRNEEKLPEPADNPGIVETGMRLIEYNPNDRKDAEAGLRELIGVLKEFYSLIEIIKLIISAFRGKEEKK